MIPAEAVEAAAKAIWELDLEPGQKQYEDCREGTKRNLRREATAMLEAAAPYMLANILEDAANTAETDELTTAAEVIYDLRRHAKDLRPMRDTEGEN